LKWDPSFCDLATFFLITASVTTLRTFFMVRPLVAFNILWVRMTFIFFSSRSWGGLGRVGLKLLNEMLTMEHGLGTIWAMKCALSVFPPDCVPFCKENKWSLCIALLMKGDLRQSGVDNGM